jgi:hypothetical protein
MLLFGVVHFLAGHGVHRIVRALGTNSRMPGGNGPGAWTFQARLRGTPGVNGGLFTWCAKPSRLVSLDADQAGLFAPCMRACFIGQAVISELG